jgi:8-oxo-dGTP diphosphatase
MTGPALFTRLVDEARRDGVPRLLVGAVITNGRDVLLLRRREPDVVGGSYELPTGVVGPGENLDAALRRAVQEETGLDVTAIASYLGSVDYAAAKRRRSRQFNFATEVAAVGPVRLREHDAHLWVSPGPEAPVTGTVKDILASYRRSTSGAGGP